MVIDNLKDNNNYITSTTTNTSGSWTYTYYPTFDGFVVLDRFYIRASDALKNDLYALVKDYDGELKVELNEKEIYIDGKLRKAEHLVVKKIYTSGIFYNKNEPYYKPYYEITCNNKNEIVNAMTAFEGTGS